MDTNPSPLLPEVADVEESLFELDAAIYAYDLTLRALGHDLDNSLKRTDFETARDDLEEARVVLRRARAGLRQRQGEFACLDELLGQRDDVRALRARMDALGFGGDDFGF